MHKITTLHFLLHFIHVYLLIKDNRRMCSNCMPVPLWLASQIQQTKHMSHMLFLWNRCLAHKKMQKIINILMPLRRAEV
jgi:hypothetical protein